jgi:hypothetical protein
MRGASLRAFCDQRKVMTHSLRANFATQVTQSGRQSGRRHVPDASQGRGYCTQIPETRQQCWLCRERASRRQPITVWLAQTREKRRSVGPARKRFKCCNSNRPGNFLPDELVDRAVAEFVRFRHTPSPLCAAHSIDRRAPFGNCSR